MLISQDKPKLGEFFLNSLYVVGYEWNVFMGCFTSYKRSNFDENWNDVLSVV